MRTDFTGRTYCNDKVFLWDCTNYSNVINLSVFNVMGDFEVF